MRLKQWISRKTASLRYSLILKAVEIVTPSLHENLSILDDVVISVPRPMINFASVFFEGKPLNCVEIGVFRGINAKSILQKLNVKKLYLIDPYKPYVNAEMNEQVLEALPFAEKNLSRFKDRVVWIKKTSEDALSTFPNNSLDLVYIDGNHAYDYVKKDLEGYWQKVKEGGIMGGHDFWGAYSGVVKAVREFSKTINRPYFGKLIDYWFIKEA